MAGRKSSNNPSIFEVAQLAGVSHQTVSRVINHSPNVAAATRTRVERAIQQLGYRPSNSARALASQRSRTIGVIAGGQRFYGPMSTLASIQATAHAHTMFVSVAMVHEAQCTQPEFDDLCNMLTQQGADAFIFLTPTESMFEMATQSTVSQPCVIITSTHGTTTTDNMLLSPTVPPEDLTATRSLALVGVDQWGGMRAVMEYIYQCGHRNMLFFAGPTQWRDACTRSFAWESLCVEYAVQSRTIPCSDWNSTDAYQYMTTLLDDLSLNRDDLPTCVVCSNDVMAIGVIRALFEHGLRVPDDVSVTGFDDMPGMNNLYPPLTTVRQDFDAVGAMAMHAALSMMQLADEPQYGLTRHHVGLAPADLIVRQSVRTLPSSFTS